MSEEIRQLRTRYRREALERGISPRDVDLLLADRLGGSVSHLIAHDDERLDPGEALRFENEMRRRFAGEPLQYIRGWAEFFSRNFEVDSRVLIPRPETELLVETILELAPAAGRVLDVGTGSGCIAISVEQERKDLEVFGCDRSLSALAVASRNRSALGSRVRLVTSDLLNGITGTFDVIASNPPYIASGDLATLALEVQLHEPHGALSPGTSGFEVIDRLMDEGRTHLRTNGILVMEIGWGQAGELEARAAAREWRLVNVANDLAGIPRVVTLKVR